MKDRNPPPATRYKKGDMRRMLAVLGAMHSLGDDATLVRIARRTGYNNKTVLTQIDHARREAAVLIAKDGPRYTVLDWGPAIKQRGAVLALNGDLNSAPETE